MLRIQLVLQQLKITTFINIWLGLANNWHLIERFNFYLEVQRFQ